MRCFWWMDSFTSGGDSFVFAPYLGPPFCWQWRWKRRNRKHRWVLFPQTRGSHRAPPRCEGVWKDSPWLGSHFTATYQLCKGYVCVDFGGWLAVSATGSPWRVVSRVVVWQHLNLERPFWLQNEEWIGRSKTAYRDQLYCAKNNSNCHTKVT